MKRYAALAVAAAVLVVVALWLASARTGYQNAETTALAQQAPESDPLSAPYIENLPASAKAKLAQDGFVIPQGASYISVSALYRGCKRDNIPILVTTDAMLHTSHQLFDWCLRFLEMGYLRNDLLNLTDTMLREMMGYHGESKAKLPQEAALLAASYFSVAKRLLASGDAADIPQPYGVQIQKEIDLVLQAEGFHTSPLMGYREDYSQYKPRGHYSRSQPFEQYFRCMMWYGRMTFRVSSATLRQPGVTLDEKSIRRQALAAAMVCSALRRAQVKGETAQAVWKRIYETTGHFAGPSDDLTFLDCERAVAAAYGTRPRAAHFADERKLPAFMARVQKLRKPRILSTLAVWRTKPGWEEQTQAVSFLGQRFSVDALIFRKLIFDSVGKWRGGPKQPFTAVYANGMWIRGLPRGLDVMAALGSDVALRVLEQEGDTAYQGYDERLKEVRQAISALEVPEWRRDLYLSRLAAAKALLGRIPDAAPNFCKGETWRLKQLHTALASWTELKHDTLLYTKQPYSMAQAAMAGVGKAGPPPPKPRLIHGYVEPTPQVFGRLAGAVEGLRDKLTELGYPRDRALERNLDSYAGLLRQLETIARKELAGQALSDEEYDLVWNIGDKIRLHLSFPHYTDVSVRFMTRMDQEMPVVADVATDVNSGQVLEQAVGWPMIIYAVAPVDGRPTVCKGVTYSYYEFKQPMSNRLTDEEWRKLLVGDKTPTRPQWSERFITERAGR